MTTPLFAVLFPGQGSQALGMMADYQDDPSVKATFAEASDVLGVDIWAIMQDETRLNDTQFTQPVLLTASVALWRKLLPHMKIAPSYLAGHSLGEYSALCASEVLSLGDAVKLVNERGRLMAQAVVGIDTQMMAVLGLADEQVADICYQVTQTVAVVDPANFNSPSQVVVAGTRLGVEAVMQEVQALGKKCVPLNVSVPSHCQLMKGASEQLASLLHKTNFNTPRIPVIQNLTASVNSSALDIKDALIKQLSEPVQWTKTMAILANNEVSFVVECGYGTVLSNLAKRQSIPLPAFSIDNPTKFEKLLEQL